MLDDTVLVEIEDKLLTDGSHVYDVIIDTVRWRTPSKRDAEMLQDAIVEAARKHALNDTVRGLQEIAE